MDGSDEEGQVEEQLGVHRHVGHTVVRGLGGSETDALVGSEQSAGLPRVREWDGIVSHQDAAEVAEEHRSVTVRDGVNGDGGQHRGVVLTVSVVSVQVRVRNHCNTHIIDQPTQRRME